MKMERKALIIGNPGERGAKNYCRGVEKDLEEYVSFFLSPIGGAWREPEIVILDRPSTEEVRVVIRSLRRVDYAIVIFSGHGFTRADSQLILELKTDQRIEADELKRGAPKQTLVLDCCRVVEKPTRLFIESMKKAMIMRAAISDSQCRQFYDLQIQLCSP